MNSTSYELDQHVQQFQRDGYTIFPGVFNEEQMQGWRELFHQLQGEPKADKMPSYWFGGIFERAPERLLPAVSHPLLLDFAERVMGPFVQLDNLSLVAFPTVDPEASQGKVTGWHRDRWACVPAGCYERPLAINAISYFQDLDEHSGPLRVLVGSHREPVTLDVEERTRPHAEERIVCAKAGDVVVIHNRILHTGTPNTSGKPRYFFSLYYNLTWMKTTDDHSGPRTREIVEASRARRDARTMRLFGVDENMAQRNNWGFMEPDEVHWEKWAAEDRAAVLGEAAA
jgi:hypothetical protein